MSQIILDHQDRFLVDFHEMLSRIAQISKALRKERELSFYGDIDFIPTEEYSLEDAVQAAGMSPRNRYTDA